MKWHNEGTYHEVINTFWIFLVSAALFLLPSDGPQILLGFSTPPPRLPAQLVQTLLTPAYSPADSGLMASASPHHHLGQNSNGHEIKWRYKTAGLRVGISMRGLCLCLLATEVFWYPGKPCEDHPSEYLNPSGILRREASVSPKSPLERWILNPSPNLLN